MLDRVSWRPYPSGSGEWCFLDQAPAQLVERLEKNGQATIGKYTYALKSLTCRRRKI
ncbi:MAG: hypothetical protein NXY59_08190 [Aigarchaeota archaeon]|nr:hypothetical protein [Candidatus Pelearchaeum maunauluense]